MGEKRLQKFWKELWNLIKFTKSQIYYLAVLTLVFELVKLISPYLLKLIIDDLTVFDPGKITEIVILIVLMFFSSQLASIFDYFRDKGIFTFLIAVEYELPVRAQKKLAFLSLSYHERENTGNKIVKIERGVQKILDLLGNMSWEVVPTILQLFITVIVLFIVDYRFGLSVLVFAPLFVIITYYINRRVYPMRKKRHENYEVASGKLGQSIININTVKSFVQERREIMEYTKIRNSIKIDELKEWYFVLKFGYSRNIVIELGRTAILLLGIFLVFKSAVTIGTLIFVITLSEKAYFSMWRLTRFYDRLEEGAEAVSRLATLINEKEDIVNPENGFKPEIVNGCIEFKDLAFRYKGGTENALENVNLRINEGCITALVGPSGGGKTTVARMIYRHYDPQKGAVLLDKIDLRKYDLYSFRKFIAIVPQEVEIFDTSVKDNISYAKPRATMEEIKAAARIANAEEFIEKLDKKYNTEVGERGIKLSGGQRQRVGIARAILANPRILIFDEATSNLDSYSEKLIQEAMDKISKGRTVIIIAHRLSTIKKADKIIVLEEGRVVEQGSHFELAKTDGGLYSKLLKLQRLGDVE